MNNASFAALCVSLAVSSLNGLNASAQTNQRLLEEGLISPAVYEILNRRGADTREERMQALQEACSLGQLPPSDCANTRRRREY